MDRKVIITAILIAMLSVVFSMSGDGGNVPVVSKEGAAKVTDNETPQSTSKTDQADRVKSNETVKDEFGVDTRMTKKEYDKFKEEYIDLKSIILPASKSDMLFKYKVDLNKFDEFKKFGIDLKKSGDMAEAKTYKDNSLYSEIIVVGEIIGTEIVAGSDSPKYKIKIEEILKGEEIFKDKLGYIPDYVHYVSGFACGYWVSDDNEPVINSRGIYFLWDSQKYSKDRLYLQKRGFSTILFSEDHGYIYEKNINDIKTLKWLQSKKNKSDNLQEAQDSIEKSLTTNEKWEQIVDSIRQIIKLNDSKNFYNRKYQVEVKK